MLYERLLKPVLFSMDPEEAHERVMSLLAAVQCVPFGSGLLSMAVGAPANGLEREVFGIRFPNPIGLAAGLDKDALVPRALAALGFGFVELGSITLRPQPGNPKPRLFRLPDYEALINRMGFNSQGAKAAARRLKKAGRLGIPVGINLGLNADCPPEKAAQEYSQAFEILEPYGDYFAVNVSSPNTKGLRALQDKLQLERILTAIGQKNRRKKPLLVKLSPELDQDQLREILPVISRLAAGVIATNTTLRRESLPSDLPEMQGGLSGAPLRDLSTSMVRLIARLTDGQLPIIGVGGVSDGASAFEKLRAGASLVQVYTGFVYRGPGLPVRISRELKGLLAAEASA